MKKSLILPILSILILSACSTNPTTVIEQEGSIKPAKNTGISTQSTTEPVSSSVTPIVSNEKSSEYTISGIYSTPEVAPDYVVITPNNPTIGNLTVKDFISPTTPSEDLLNLFNLLPTSERPKDCPFYRNGKVTLTIKNLKKVEATSPSTSSAFQADIVSIGELGKAECYSY